MIGIYEPLYLPGQKITEPAFRPLRRRENARADWREFGILIEMYRSGLHRQHKLTGLLSPRFREKTGTTGAAFIAFIEANPGADVYMINPYPHIAYLTYNVWTQGMGAHHGLLEAAQALLDACGIGWNLDETPRHGPDTMCYSNYWVASEEVWDYYVGGVLDRIAGFLEREPESAAARAVMANTRYFEPTPFLPFIIERLFSTYLSHERPVVRPYLLDPVATCINDFERDTMKFLIGRVKQADRDGDFPDEMKRWMHLLHRLRRHFTIAQYATRPLPVTGRVLAPEYMETARRELAREAGPEPLE